MYTQCPHCQTLFRISSEQLKAAAGKAHCCRCDRVFSALDNLREPPPATDWPESRLIEAYPPPQNLELPFDSPAQEISRGEMHSSLSELLLTLQISPETPAPEPEQEAAEGLARDDERDPFEPLYHFDDPEMDSVRIGLDSQLHESIEPPVEPPPESARETDFGCEPDTAGEETVDADTEPGYPSADAPRPARVPFDIPHDLPEIQPAETAPLSLEESLEDIGRRRGTLGWSLAILLLLLVALGQLAWFGRDHLLRYPAGRELLESACELLLCQLPPRHEPEKLHVVSRAITTHPDREGALKLMLILRNDADFIQPWPQLELSLLDSSGGLIARRRFSPEEYRDTPRGLLQPGIPETIHLELEDPGDQVVGFQFDFY
ncbi:DUF3426 domain-containing protein [Sedimenticola hydrogenitrophicus]|uniref:DUF3426 domain-containing protein n=1 Tax=Sedimenticola hydrogenitrophicus TaxID=2967975 RepID=UPI0021A39DD0